MDGAGSEGAAMSDLSVRNILDDRFHSTDEEDYDIMDIKAIMNLDLLSVILPEDHSSIGDLDYISFGTCEVDDPVTRD